MGVSQGEGNRREMEEKFGMDGNSLLVLQSVTSLVIPKDGTQQMRRTRLPEMSTALLETAGVLNMN